MSVACYEVAKQQCNQVIYEDFKLNLVSIEMFVALKLVAWDSRKAAKDLNDIVYVIDHYANLPLIETQITELGIVNQYDDLNEMAAAILAFNMRNELDHESLNIIIEIFQEGMSRANRSSLIRKMQKYLPPHLFPNTKSFLEVFSHELSKD